MSSKENESLKKTTSTSALKDMFDNDSEENNSSADSLDTNANLTHAELQKKLAESEEKVKTSWDRVLRMQADIDNIHRRTERDVANAHKYALEKFVQELLPVIDSMDRCLEIPEDANNAAILQGVSLTLKIFNSALEKFGVESVNPKHEDFNPEYHQAVSVLADDSVKPNTVLQVLQKGYLLNNRLVRPAMVVVSKA